MHADSAFFIGKGHKTCQDYAIHSSLVPADGFVSAILTDGCSSSPSTDIGARLIAHGAAMFMNEVSLVSSEDDFDTLYNKTIYHAANIATQLRLPNACLDATLLTIIAQERSYIAQAYGDGVIAIGRTDGTIEVMSAEYGAGYPDYLNYRSSKTRNLLFSEQSEELGNSLHVTEFTINPDGTVIDGISYDGHNNFLDEYTINKDGYKERELWRGDYMNVKRIIHSNITVEESGPDTALWLAVLSDGARAFVKPSSTTTTKSSVAVPLAEVLHTLLSFKNFEGEFAQRRCQKFWKDCIQKGWQCNDDLSLAVLYRGEWANVQ